MTNKKTRGIAEQLKVGGGSLDKWARGEKKLRTTLVAKDGTRETDYLTRDEMVARREEIKQRRAHAFKDIRAEMGLSQPGFARLLHAGSAAVKQWETGRRTIPAPVMALAELARDPVIRERLSGMVIAPDKESTVVTRAKKRAV